MKAFIDEHRDAHGVEPICKVLPIAPSTYYAHAARQADPDKQATRAKSDAALMIEIRRVFDENFGVYGVRKIWRQLGREGIEVARCTVARLMRVLGLQGVVRGRKIRTAALALAGQDPGHRVVVEPTLLTQAALRSANVRTLDDRDAKIPAFGQSKAATAPWIPQP